MESLRAGRDPYSDAMAVQRAYQANPHAYEPGVAIPYSYVYSPVTLPLLRAVMLLPMKLSGAIYWAIFFLAIAVTLWVCMQFIEPEERSAFGPIVPMAVFFPGMLENDCFWSGNIAYVLYTACFAAALLGWRRGRWGWFYVAVLAVSCVKAPMLTLLAIPVFSARRQWVRAGVTAVAGLALFAVQPRIWPALFANYLEAIDLQFRFNRDFSSSPAGLIANALFFRAPYKTVSAVSYLSYAVLIVAALALLSRRFHAGRLTLREFAPVLLVGTILLNPRIMEYDLAPVTIPMALIVWRFCDRVVSSRLAPRQRNVWWTAVAMALLFASSNILATRPHAGLDNPPWKLTAGWLISLTFVAGTWELMTRSRERDGEAANPSGAGDLLAAL
jgi:hypothetical protein